MDIDELESDGNWVDEEWGDIVSCEAIPLDDTWPWNKGTCVPNPNPWITECRFKVVYENEAEATLVTRAWAVMTGIGFDGEILKKGKFEAYPDYEYDDYEEITFFNPRLVATAAKALSKGEVIPPGKVQLLDNVEAVRVLKEFGIPTQPCKRNDEYLAEKREEWKRRWIESGICEDNGSGGMVTRWLAEEQADG